MAIWAASMARHLAAMKHASSAGLLFTAATATFAATTNQTSHSASTDCEHEKIRDRLKKDSKFKLKTRVSLPMHFSG